MADYIDDTGTHTMDALLSGTYTTQASNHALTLGADGEADTTFTLPTGSDWILVETYDVEDVSGDIGYTKWQSDVSQVTTDIEAIQDIVDADSQITVYKMTAMHYKSSTGKVDVYRGDEATTLALASEDTDNDFTFPPGDWIITDTILAPDAKATVLETTYVSFDQWESLGSFLENGIYYNVFDDYSSSTDSIELVDDSNITTGETADQTVAFYYFDDPEGTGRDSGDNSYCARDDLLSNIFMVRGSSYNGQITLGLTASTDYKITIGASSAEHSGEELKVILTGATESISDGVISDVYATPPECGNFEFTTDSTPTDIILTFNSNTEDTTTSAASGFKIERLS